MNRPINLVTRSNSSILIGRVLVWCSYGLVLVLVLLLVHVHHGTHAFHPTLMTRKVMIPPSKQTQRIRNVGFFGQPKESYLGSPTSSYRTFSRLLATPSPSALSSSPRSQPRKKQSRSSLLHPQTPTTAIQTKKTDTNRNGAVIKDTQSNNDETATDEVYGAKFFGGSAIKDEFFDPQIEEEMTRTDVVTATTVTVTTTKSSRTVDTDGQKTYARFYDTQAFPNDISRQFGQGLQTLVNSALYDNDNDDQHHHHFQEQQQIPSTNVLYSTQNFYWETPFKKSTTTSNYTPMDEIQQALLFYKRLDIAIISCTLLSQSPSLASSSSSASSSSLLTFQVRWAISCLWPNILQSRVLLTGGSTMTALVVDTTTATATTQQDTMNANNNNKNNKNKNPFLMIQSQSDVLDVGGKDGRDIIQAIAFQLQPRFWDLYHLGMTPSAEIMTRIYNPSTSSIRQRPKPRNNNIFSSYSLFEIPPSLVYQTTVLDTGNREDRNAQHIPNQAFTCFIKTMGPSEQRYIPTSPVEIQIRSNQGGVGGIGGNDTVPTITWTIQLCPEFLSYSDTLPIGMDEVETKEEKEDISSTTGYSNYVYTSQRLVATMPYGGNPQDKDITDLRKKLYETVVLRDGWKPKLDAYGKPIFFYLQSDVKTCFTSESGFGMVVYDWRPQFVKGNEVGIELC